MRVALGRGGEIETAVTAAHPGLIFHVTERPNRFDERRAKDLYLLHPVLIEFGIERLHGFQRLELHVAIDPAECLAVFAAIVEEIDKVTPASLRHWNHVGGFNQTLEWEVLLDDGVPVVGLQALLQYGDGVNDALIRQVLLGYGLVEPAAYSLAKERQEGRSLALLNADIIGFDVERKSDEDLQKDIAKFAALRNQPDLFNTKPIIPYQPCPYRFKYRYRTDDGVREGTCQDWELEATYFRWSRASGEAETLAKMQQTFGEEYPRKGMLLAMGTHSLYPDTWLINGVIRLDAIEQLAFI